MSHIKPTFLLKGIDPNELLDAYNKGIYSKYEQNNTKIIVTQTNSILAPTYGSSNKDPVFCVKDKNNNNIIIATSKHVDYEVFNSSGGNLPEGGRCDHCKIDFDHVVVGYPVAYQEQILLIDEEISPHYKTIYIFWTEGELCSFECALTKIRETQQRSCEYRDNNTRDSESMLRMLYKFMHPNDGILRPAQDYGLLKSNRGSLTMEEWNNNKHVYVKTDKILLMPAKHEYIQENFIKPYGIPINQIQKY